MSLHDTVRGIESSIPGAKVINAKHFSDPAGMQAHERGTKQFKDRVKRTTDEEFGGQKYKPGSVQAKRFEAEASEIEAFCLACEYKRLGAHRKLKPEAELRERWFKDEGDIYYVRDGSAHFLKSARYPEELFFYKKMIGGCGEEKMEFTDEMYDPVPIPNDSEGDTEPCVSCKNPTTSRRYKVWKEGSKKWKLQRKGIAQRGLGGMERTNENIGGMIAGHGAPEVAEAMRRSGVLQTRRDENGNPVTTAVFRSERHKADVVKEFNRRQAEAQARGFRGTRGGVKFLRHGGLTPD